MESNCVELLLSPVKVSYHYKEESSATLLRLDVDP